MEIHLHLSRQWRALDHKWGTPVDLDTADADTTSHFDVQLDVPAETFSAESYLRAIKRNRPTPYSRNNGDAKRMGKIKQPSTEAQYSGPVAKKSELQNSALSLAEPERSREDSLVKDIRGLVEELEASMEESYMFNEKCLGESSENMAVKRRVEFESVFKQLKNAALSYRKKKYHYVCEKYSERS